MGKESAGVRGYQRNTSEGKKYIEKRNLDCGLYVYHLI